MAFVASMYPSKAIMVATGCLSMLSASLLKYALFVTQQMAPRDARDCKLCGIYNATCESTWGEWHCPPTLHQRF